MAAGFRRLLLLGLIAAISARPTVDEFGEVPLESYDPTKCALDCKDRQVWKGYEVGKTFEYKFNHSSLMQNVNVDGNAVWLSVSGKAYIAVASACEMVLTVKVENQQASNFKTWDPANRNSPRQVFENMESKPLRFSYNDGQIKTLCPSNDEERVELNLKRSILSNFQLSIPKSTAAASVTERDIMGDCPTEYTPLSALKVTKVKELASCTGRDRFYSPIQGERYTSDAGPNALPLLKSSFECNLDFQLQGSAEILNSATCNEEHVLRPFSRGSAGAKAKITSQLIFVTVSSEIKPLSKEAIQKRTNLQYEHRSTEHCHKQETWSSEVGDSTECLERGELADGETFSTNAVTTLTQMCSQMKLRTDVRPELPELFMNLVKNLRGLNSADEIYAVHQKLIDGLCSGNDVSKSNLKQYFHDALPLLGTEAGIQVMTKFLNLQAADISASDRKAWLSSLAFIRHPTRRMVQDLLPLLQSNLPDYSQVVLPMSSLIYHLCKNDVTCAQDASVRQVIETISSPLQSDCQSATPEKRNEVLLALRAIGNMGQSTKEFQTFYRCMENKNIDMESRVAAAQALRRMDCGHKQFPFDSLISIVKNLEYDSELRINAYISLMRCAEQKDQIIPALFDILDQEKSQQVGSFMYSHLTNLAKTNDDFKKDVSFKLRNLNLKKKFDLDARSFSRNIERSFFSEAMNSGGKFESNIIFSPQSFVPRSINVNLTLDMFGRSMNLLEVGARVQGLESVVESFMAGGSNARQRPNAQSANTLSTFLNENQRSFAKPTETTSGSIYYRVFGNEIDFINLKSLSNMEGLSFEKVLAKLAQTNSIERAKSNVFIESVVSMPTVAGLPLLLKLEGISSTYLKMQGKAKIVSMMGKVEFNAQVSPSGAVRVVGSMSVDGFFAKTGIKLIANAHTSTAASVSVNLDGSELEIEMTPGGKDTQDVFSFTTNVLYFHHTAGKAHVNEAVTPPPQSLVSKSRCTSESWKKMIGFSLCLDSQYYESSSQFYESTSDSPSYPLTGPSKVQLVWTKADSHSAYKLIFKVKQEKDKLNVLFDMNTPGSRVPRQFAFQLKKEVTPSESLLEVSLKTPWRQAALVGKLGSVSNNPESKIQNAELSLVIDETRRYALIGQIAKSGSSSGTKSISVMKGNFKVTLPDRTEQPSFQYSYKTDYSADGIKTSVETSIDGITVGGQLQNYKFEVNSHVRQVSGRQLFQMEIKYTSLSKVLDFHISRETSEAPQKLAINKVILNCLNKDPKLDSWHFHIITRLLNTGPLDYNVKVSQLFRKVVNGAQVNRRHPIDFVLEADVQYRPQSWKRINGKGTLKYTSPKNNKEATLKLSDVILGLENDELQVKGGAQCKIEWSRDSSSLTSEHKILYERRKDWRLLDFIVLNEIKTTGRKDIFKISHKVASSSENGLSVKQEVDIKLTGRVDGNFVHEIETDAATTSYKQVIKSRLNERNFEVKSVYSKKQEKHKVESKAKLNGNTLGEIEVSVKLPGQSGDDFSVKVNGKVNAVQFDLSHKHSFSSSPSSKSLKIDQLVDIPKYNIKYVIKGVGSVIGSPQIGYKLGFDVENLDKKRYGFLLESESIRDPEYDSAMDTKITVFAGADKFVDWRKIRLRTSPNKIKGKYIFKREEFYMGKTNKFDLSSEMLLDSSNGYIVKLKNSLKGRTPFFSLISILIPSTDIDYQSDYSVEYSPPSSDGQRKLKIQVKQNNAPQYFIDGKYSISLSVTPDQTYKTNSELQLATSFERVKKVEYKSSFLLEKREISKLKYIAFTKINGVEVIGLKSTNELQLALENLGHKSELEVLYFGNKLKMNSNSQRRTDENRNSRDGLFSFQFTNVEGTNYKGAITTKYAVGKQYFNFIDAEVDLKFENINVRNYNIKLLHKMVRESNGIPAEFNGKVTMKTDGVEPAVFTYTTRHEISAQQILATLDVKSTGSYLFPINKYQFRSNFEYVRMGFPRVFVIELLASVEEKKFNVNLNYERTANQIKGNLIVQSNINRQINCESSMRLKFENDFKTADGSVKFKLNELTLWDEIIEWDIESIQKVKKIVYKLTSQFELIRSLNYGYNHDFTGSKRLLKLTGDRNDQKRIEIVFDYSSDDAPKSIVINLQPGEFSAFSTQLPHLLFSMQRTGTPAADYKNVISLEIKPFFKPITSTIEILSAATPKTFQGMPNANFGFNVVVNTPFESLSQSNVLFVMSADSSEPKVKILLDLKPMMTEANKLSFEGSLARINNRVSLSTVGSVLGRSITLKYNRNILNPSPLTLEASVELLNGYDVVSNLQFNMVGFTDITLKGKSALRSPSQIYTLNFEHKASSVGNFETKLAILNPQNEPYTALLKMAFPTSYKEVDLTVELKTPMSFLKSFQIKLEHRHKNPVEIFSDVTEKVTFNYENAQTSYSGEWTLTLQKSLEPKFGVTQAYLKFLMGLKIPFTVRREMNVALELAGNIKKAQLMASLRPRIARDYILNMEHDVPNWLEYRQQAKFFAELTLPDRPAKFSLNINRTPSQYSVLATAPLEAVKRLSLNMDKINGIGALECDTKLGLIELKSDLAKYLYSSTAFTSVFLSMKIPNLPDSITISVKKEEPRSYILSYKRGFNSVDLNVKYENSFEVKRKVMVDLELTCSKFNWLGDFQHGKITVNHERDANWLSILHQSELIFNRVSIVKLQGSMNRNPDLKTLELQMVEVGSYFDGTINYSRDWIEKKAKLVISVDKIQKIPQLYALTFNFERDADSFLKEYNLKVDIPSRIFVLRRRSETTEANLRSWEFEIALDKRRNQRVRVYFTPYTKSTSLTINLPTQSYTHIFHHSKDAPNLRDSRRIYGGYSLNWGEDNNPQIGIDLKFKIDREPGRSLKFDMNTKSMFMKKPLLIKLDAIKHSEEKSTIELFVSAGDADTNKLTLIRETPRTGDKIRIITVEFVSVKKNMPFINMKAVGDAKRGLKSQILLGFQLDATTDSSILEAPLSVKWIGLFDPWRRFVLSSTSGASMDFNYKPQAFGSKLTMFISNSRKEAARLTFERDMRKPKITAQLDRGIGYVVMKMPFVSPYYTPNEARIKFSIGLSDADTANILALIGSQNLAKSVSGWTKQTHDLGFFFLGAKLTPENLIKFSSKYRLGKVVENLSGDQIVATSTNAIYDLRSYLFAKITSDPVVTQFRNVRRACFMSIVKTVTENLDGSLVMSSVQQLVVNDYDAFMRYLQKMIERNELFSAQISTSFVALKGNADYYMAMLSQVASAAVTRIQTSLSGIVASMQQRRLEFRNFINTNWVKIQRLISDPAFLNNFFGTARQIIDGILSKIQACFNRLDVLRNAARELFSQTINQAQIYMNEMLSQYPGLVERARVIKEFCSKIRMTLLEFVQSNIIQPIMSNADVQQMLANVMKIRESMKELRQSVQSYKLFDALPNSKRLSIFMQNRREALRYLMAGDIKKAFQAYTQIELYKLIKFELLCPLATKEECDAAKWHAEIDGQFYMPIYIPNFRFFRNPLLTLVRTRIKNAIRRIRTMGSKVYIDATTKVFDTLTRVKQIRKNLTKSYFFGIPPFEASAYIVGGQRFVTFDGRHYDHAGSCSHILTHDFANNAFSIKANYAADQSKSGYYMWTGVAVHVDGKVIEMLANGQVTVDGKQQNLPYLMTGSDLTAMRLGDRITVERANNRDFSVTCFTSHKFCRVTVSRWMYNQVGGLLGTFDNEQYNDLMLPSRKVVPLYQLEEFTNAWAVGNCPKNAGLAKTNNVIPNQCESLFQSPASQFSNCFDYVNVEPVLQACANEHLQDGTICQTAALYITQCEKKGIVLQIPSQCIKCKLPDQELSAEQSIKVLPATSESTKKRDYIFVMEASTCVKGTLDSIRHLSLLLESANSKFGLVLYGGAGIYDPPHQHTIGQNNLQCSGANFRTGLTKAESLFTTAQQAYYFANSITMSIRALRYASLNYPSQHASERNIILVKCENSKFGINEYAMTSRYLAERGVSVHVLTKGDFLLSRSDDILYGASKTHVFTSRDKAKAGRLGVTLGRSDLLNSVKIPKDLSTALALQTPGGAVWNLNKLTDSEPQMERRNMLKVVANVLKTRANPQKCARCRCRLNPDNISSQLDCKLCEEKINYNFWQVENFD